MTTTGQNMGATSATAAPAAVKRGKGSIVVSWLTTTDHKTIGYLYLIVSFVFFCLAGVMALLIRAELFEPGLQILQTKEQYNQLFTMHGTAMLLMFATPLFAGFTNVIMPLQIGAPDVAFPRLNALAFWFFLFGSIIATSGAPICSGMITFAKPANSGVANISSIMVPCMVKSWLYCSLVCRICIPGSNSSARMSRAITPAIMKNTNDEIRYIYPMILWSVDVIHVTTILPLRRGTKAGATGAALPGRECPVMAIFHLTVPP